jgi:sodium/potassium-transporting ATPase subunit alpha
MIHNATDDNDEETASFDSVVSESDGDGDIGGEHLLSLAETSQRFPNSGLNMRDLWHSNGLTMTDARARLLQDGANTLAQARQASELIRFFRQFLNLFIVLLTMAAILSLGAYFFDTAVTINLYLAIILFVVVILTCLMSYVEERKTAKVMSSFVAMLPPSASVLRDGQVCAVPAAELVRGDLVLLTAGVKVAADMRLLASRGLRVENSSLTGESTPLLGIVDATSVSMLESHNMVFNSSLVTTGDALGIVLQTGDRTQLGSIAGLASSTAHAETTMQREVKYFVRIIAAIAITMGVVFFIVGIARGQHWLSVFVNGFITVIVANVPQGLPATVTSLLTISASRLKKRSMFIKRLDSVETLGSVNLICSDKTGTLTQNRLTVVDMWLGAEAVHTPPSLEEWLAASPSQFPCLAPLQRIVALCNGARETTDEHGERSLVGNPVDISLLLSFGARATMSLREHATDIVYERPFNSRAKNHVAVVAIQGTMRRGARKTRKAKHGGTQMEANVKGAPEVVLGMCTHFLDRDGDRHAIDARFRAAYTRTYEQFASTGCRALGFGVRKFVADRAVFADEDDESSVGRARRDSVIDDSMLHVAVPRKGYTFVGMTAMADPPRERVGEAVEACHKAGIKVFMVTGDHPLTARAVAEQVGVLQSRRHRLRSHSRTSQSIVLAPDGVVTEADSFLAGHDDACDELLKAKSLSVASFSKMETLEHALTVVLGARIATLSGAEWDRIFAQQGVVFARTTPQHKLSIVEEARNRGFVVAVTGDGVNDAPALKAAHIGVAMGMCGTSVAREAADVILMDDDFATIVDGIREGRILFDNLKKTIAFTLAHLLPEVVPVLLTLAVSFPLGLSSLLILCIDCGTELVPAISLSYEPAEHDIMSQMPRNVNTDRLVSWQLLSYSYLQAGVVISLVCVGAWLAVFTNNNVPLSALPFSYETKWMANATSITGIDLTLINADEQVRILSIAQSVFFTVLVVSQLWHVWFCKTRRLSVFEHPTLSNVVTDVGVVFSLALLCFIVYVPYVQAFFFTSNVDSIYWAYTLISLASFFAFNELRRLLVRTRPRWIISKALTW